MASSQIVNSNSAPYFRRGAIDRFVDSDAIPSSREGRTSRWLEVPVSDRCFEMVFLKYVTAEEQETSRKYSSRNQEEFAIPTMSPADLCSG